MTLETTHTYLVAIIGAGPGGICAAVRLRQAGIEDFVVLERADGIGGTWRRNRYPGLTCDIASHFYSFSFAPKPDWSRPFAGQAEILSYLEEVVSTFDIRPDVHLGISVEAAAWDHEAALWRLTTGDGDTVTAETVIASPGMFGELRYPQIEGMDSFRGASFHTGAWPPGHSLSGERVAIVGSAASAVQLLPEAAEVADPPPTRSTTTRPMRTRAPDATATSPATGGPRPRPRLGHPTRRPAAHPCPPPRGNP